MPSCNDKTFVLDFVNDPEEILDEFKVYFQTSWRIRPQQTFVSESFAVTATCENDTNVSAALGGAVVSYAQSGKASAVASETTAGTYALADIVEGQTYTVNVIPRGVTLAAGATTSFTVTADGTDESCDVSVTCSTTTGGN